MDNDLIHRDQALEMLAKQKQLTPSVVRRVLLQIPTVDAVEVARYGQWEEQLDGSHYCSECGRDATFNFEGVEVLGVTCPYCGVIMRGDSQWND